eukprot:UN28198
MSHLQDRFISECDNSQIGLNACLQEFENIMKKVDSEVFFKIQEQELDSRYYALRWLSLLLSMEFELPEVLRLWDSFFADPKRFEFVSFY